MNRINLTLLICVFGFTNLVINAQENRFYMPSEIKQAYEKGTRSWDGMPGENYWQNRVDYDIDVTIFPEQQLIDGHEVVTYYNNSPDEIYGLVIRLYNNAYKKGNSRAFGLNEKDIHDGVKLENITINGIEYNFYNRSQARVRGTNVVFQLEEPLMPGANLKFETSWRQKIPAHSRVRTGAYDSTSFFVAYWYPQVSVYDDIFGWDELNFSMQTEFYNNLANFDVEITVPDGFVVLATGTLSNASEVMHGEMLERYKKAKSSTDKIEIVTLSEAEGNIKLKSNTWHYKASEVSDFAIALSDHYRWDAAVQPVAGRDVLISGFYPADTTRDYSKLVEIQQKTMKHFSEDIPGVPYPYEAFTTFNARGGGGMEYPMMANNGGPGRGVTIHEMFHTYFPMYVRTNERIWAWMDEGWAVYNTAIVSNRFFDGDESFASLFSDGSRGGLTGTISDLPLFTSSDYMTDNYGYHSYSKAALVYAILHHYLGDEVFFRCYREYIERWAKKAPSPFDFFYTFEDVSGEDLGWLWKPWFYEFGASDLAIQSFENGQLTIANVGGLPMPVMVEVEYNDGETEMLAENAGVWKDGSDVVKVDIPNHNKVERISVNRMTAEATPDDNYHPSIESLYKNYEIPEEIIGRYETEGGFVIDITNEDGIVYLRIPAGRMDMMLVPEERNSFKSIDASAGVKFIMDDSGNCSGLDFDWYRVIHAEKVKQE